MPYRGVGTCASVHYLVVLKCFGHTGQFFWSHLHTNAVGELFCGSQPTATTCLRWIWRIKECFALASALKDLWYAGFPPAHWPDGYAMLISLNKGETAVHCRGDMVVRMRKVLAIPRSWYVCSVHNLALLKKGFIRSGSGSSYLRG